MARVAFKFEDLVTEEVYFLPVNPNEDNGGLGVAKSSAYQVSTATYRDLSDQLHVNGTLIFATPDEQQKFSYSGNVYTRAQYETFEAWANKRYPWQMTDDIGRTFLIYVESLQYEVVRSRQYPWKHSYKFDGWVLAEIGD